MYLGIAQTNHGSSAAVYDGVSLYASSEERFDRRKFSSGYPRKAISWCLKEANISIHDIKAVAFYMTTTNHLISRKDPQNDIWQNYSEALYTIPSEILKKIATSKTDDVKYIRQSFEFYGGSHKDIYFVDHHLAHAAASYLLSGFNDSAILCLDANGDGYTMSWMEGVGSKINPKMRQPFPHSIGHLYAAFTQYLGFNPNSDEYKIMGMAAYGKAERFYEKIKKMVRLSPDGSFELDMSYFSFNMPTERYRYNSRFVELMGFSPNNSTDTIMQEYFDISAALQLVFEETIQHILNGLSRCVPSVNLSYGGGTALNCLANGKVIPKSKFTSLFIPPDPGDPGLAIGCAAYLAHVIDAIPRNYIYQTDYLGPSYSIDRIKSTLSDCGIKFSEPIDQTKIVAEKIANSKVVGLFQGRQEFGPRALGNRSILADPRHADMKEIVNKKIKFREPFRPFATSLTKDCSSRLFNLKDRKLNPNSPESFMLTTTLTNPEWKDKLQSTTHLDQTSRIQILEPQQNPSFHSIIKEFGKLSGIEAVLNTSFNVKDEPIVLTPDDAIRCFYSTGIDALAIGPFLIEKN